jgi:nitrogen fixation protein
MQVVDSEGYLKVKLVGGPVGPFVPYTGATANVDLGEYEIKVGQLTLDTSPTGTAAVGTTRWNNTIGSSETTLKGGSVILKNGVDLVARVVNKVTPNTTLTKANYPAVRVSGAQGQRLAVAYAQANNDNNSADTIGLVIETIATNQEGFIMTVGQLEGINTTGSLQGETWVDGDVLYLSPTTPGALTNIKPTGLTGHIVVMGYVEYAHAVHGKIYVKIMNGWELDELHNVYINPATLANNNILQYDSTDQLWKNQVLSTGLTVGTTPIASGTIGRVLFQGSTNVLQQSGNLFWDEVNGRLGVGTSNPQARYHQSQTQGILARYDVTNANADQNRGVWEFYTNTAATPDFFGRFGFKFEGGINNAARQFQLHVADNTTPRFVVNGSGNVLINTTTDAGFRLDVNGTARVQGNAQFGTGFYWDNTNNRLGIGTATPTHGISHVGTIGVASFFSQRDFGFNTISQITQRAYFYGRYTSNLDSGIGIGGNVRGNTSIQSFNTNTNTATLLSLNYYGGNVIIGDYSADAGFRLDVNGTARVTGIASFNTGIIIGVGASTAGMMPLGTSGQESLIIRSGLVPSSTGTDIILTNGQGDVAITSGSRTMVSITRGFNPTSGTGVYNFFSIDATINQTGGANGAVRGIYYNPTLTSVLGTHHAFHSTSGRIRFENLPTSATGLSSGDLWNDGGTLKIV